MKLKIMLYKIKPPCGRCPYKRGIIKTTVSPCYKCRIDDYKVYEQFKTYLNINKKQIVRSICNARPTNRKMH